jgi:hypothetical protein
MCNRAAPLCVQAFEPRDEDKLWLEEVLIAPPGYREMVPKDYCMQVSMH